MRRNATLVSSYDVKGGWTFEPEARNYSLFMKTRKESAVLSIFTGHEASRSFPKQMLYDSLHSLQVEAASNQTFSRSKEVSKKPHLFAHLRMYCSGLRDCNGIVVQKLYSSYAAKTPGTVVTLGKLKTEEILCKSLPHIRFRAIRAACLQVPHRVSVCTT